ncbi:MAG: hypothetical protein JXQ90_09090 [Cyclobacteriaceae bacterium]
MRISLIGLIILIGSVLWVNYPGDRVEVEKVNGVSLVSSREPESAQYIRDVLRINANWVAIVPYAFSYKDDPKVVHSHARQWWGERPEGVKVMINEAKAHGLKVMLKPHVWVRGDGWPGDFRLKNKEEWDQWGKDYSDYLLEYAKLADSLDVEMICIGTEFRNSVRDVPEFWIQLIKQIRSVYTGKLTYAANWDNYQHVPFWEELDFIGVDAYFPLDTTLNPSVERIVDGWQLSYDELRKFSKQMDRPVLFTEYGYQSSDYTVSRPWESARQKEPNMEAQCDAYVALYQVFWKQDWFAGGFLWKWHLRSDYGGIDNSRYTPQQKPVESVIREAYRINSSSAEH